MSEVAVVTHARATMHLRIVRVDGRVQELAVPVETSLTSEDVQRLITQHQAATS